MCISDCCFYCTVYKYFYYYYYIDNICSRANSSLGFIRRNVNIGNPRVKGLAYQSYVHPVLECSPTVWDLYTVGSIKKIESVQRRAARFTLERY